jgi:spermidine synthase
MNFDNSKLNSRNFYGTLQIKEGNPDNPDKHFYSLKHGAITHGLQYQHRDKRRVPTTYFTRESGVGVAVLNHPRRQAGMQIAIIGLGVGTIASYGQRGDVIRFYEINPDVIRLAAGEGGYFSYITDSPADIDIVPGDARISMEREARANQQRYDLLVLDAFSSDAIPVHLLTKEAFALYLQILRADGIIALHISNHYLDLKPVVWRMADYYQMQTVRVESKGDADRYASTWMLVTRNSDFLGLEAVRKVLSPVEGNRGDFPLWTDDYSNLFQILK